MTTTTQTVTFLFTDIEGSTQLWERHPNEMQTALARHDALLRAAIEDNGGRVFKTIGDAFCATFDDPVDGVAACLQAQLDLAGEPWPEPIVIKVRMALHTGKAEARDLDFFGPSVNRVARLLAVAHGGQTVMSQDTVDGLVLPLGDGIELRDLGIHRLKDLLRPERVYQFQHPGLPATFPPLRSQESSAVPNNLPVQLTTFVGREEEIRRVSEILEKSRAVTLTGSGGCGKTRLALEVAGTQTERFRDGLWIVELASLTEPDSVAQSLAGTLGVREEPGQTVIQSLASQLRPKKLLLILDNCEHLLGTCAEVVSFLLRMCPQLCVMATSRESLNISGEAVFRVPSLATPDPNRDRTVLDLMVFESVKLFVDRARSVSEEFEVTSQNAQALASLCAQLDGIPLAIELAAARIRSLSVEQIASRLEDRFRLLTGGSRSALPRQQTLRALVDWSYNLLQDQERALLRRLSVFAGGWTLEEAEFVVEGDPVESWDVLDLISSLIDKSLVVFDPKKSSDRYRLLETVKRYGRDKLEESGEYDTYTARHLEYFSRLSAEAGSWARGPRQKEWLNRLDEEKENLWLALQTGLQRDDWLNTGLIAWTLGLLLQRHGLLNDAIKAIESGRDVVRAHGNEQPLVLARLDYERAGLYQDFGESARAEELVKNALAAFRAADDRAWTARSENLLGQILMSQGDFATSGDRFREALEIFEEINDRLGIAIVQNNFGVLLRRRAARDASHKEDHLAKAREHLLEALNMRRMLKDATGEAETLNNLGVIAFDGGDLTLAWTYYREALAIECDLRHVPGIATALANLGEVAGIRGNLSIASSLLATSQTLLANIGSPLAGAVKSMLADLGPPEAMSSAMSLEEAVDLVLSRDLVTA